LVDETVYARAETTLVLYDFATAGPRRMTPEVRERLLAFGGVEVPFRWRRR
jgi:acyl-CoA thioester hydrolase